MKTLYKHYLEPRKIYGITYDCLEGYHTQEYRCNDPELGMSIECVDSKAWLGTGHYFWIDVNFAHYWGQDFKKKTGYYSIYRADIEYDGILNTTFNQEHYYSWIVKIEITIQWLKSNKIDLTLKELHRFLKSKFWEQLGINGIIYDDLPHNNYSKTRKYSIFDPLYYKKRIQIVIFKEQLIHNFELLHDEQPIHYPL